MTCIVGVSHESRVWLGGDSCGSNGASWQDVGNVKVFLLGELLVGMAGSFRAIDVVRYQVPAVPMNEEPPDRFMRTTFVGALWDGLKRAELVSDGSFDGGMLVGLRGKLYEIQGDFSVLSAPDWGAAIGSGEDAARGSLWTTNTLRAVPRERVQAALLAAEAVCPSVRGPFGVMCLPAEEPRRKRKG